MKVNFFVSLFLTEYVIEAKGKKLTLDIFKINTFFFYFNAYYKVKCISLATILRLPLNNKQKLTCVVC